MSHDESPRSHAGCNEENTRLFDTSFMFHYRVFGGEGTVLVDCHYHSLLHFVHKLLHAIVRDENICRQFTNCLQTVALPKKL